MAGTFSLIKLYKTLFDFYGPQGWWPLFALNPLFYHPGDYQLPVSNNQRFEIAIGAILTQNTAWNQVMKAIKNLHHLTEEIRSPEGLSPEMILTMEPDRLEAAIKPTGYFRQKAKKLRLISQFFISLHGRKPHRKDLLAIWGVGPETADAILLYGYAVPTFVVDAYKRRIFTHLGLISEKESYSYVKNLIEKSLPRDWKLYQEFHALLVCHAKKHYSKKPYGKNDTLLTQAMIT